MRLLIKGIGAAPCLAVNLGSKGAIGLEGKVGIALAEAELTIVLAQILLYLAGSNLAASLCQQILWGEGATRLAVLPGMGAEIYLREGGWTYHIVQNAIDDAAAGRAAAGSSAATQQTA